MNYKLWWAIKARDLALGVVLTLFLCSFSLPVWAQTIGIPGYGANGDGTDVFELEGDASDFDTTPPSLSNDDWENVLSATAATNGDFNVLATTQCQDGGSCDPDWPGVLTDPPGFSLFVQGSKDIDDITGWTCRDQNAPDADEITDAYAIAYDVNGDTVVYFGADRFATNGTKTMGFWFLQTAIDLTSANALQCIPNGDGLFRTATGALATHTVGDLLILADFTQGGAVGNVRILEWVGSGGSDGSLDLLFSAGAADCSDNQNLGDVCATINQIPVDSPWTYIPKGSSSDSLFPQYAFMEGGINLSTVFADLGAEVPCFSTFIAETRSSDRVNASQKDFVIGSFNLCSIDVTKECGVNTPNLTNNPIDFTYDVAGCFNNTGAGSVTALSITDDPALDSGTLQFWQAPATPLTSSQCADYTTIVNNKGAEITNPATYTLAPGDQVLWTGKFTSTSNGDSDTVTATAEGAVGGAPISPAYDSATCPSAQFNPLLDVTKNCNVVLDASSGTELVVKVDVNGVVCNQGDVPLDNVYVVDSSSPSNTELGTLLGPINLPAQANYPTVDCDPATSSSAYAYSGSYYPDSIPAPSGGVQRYTFEDDVTATGNDPSGTSVEGACAGGTCTDMAHAECSLCPGAEDLCPPVTP